nr:P-loop NTPase fold protein [Anaerovibrio sp.]
MYDSWAHQTDYQKRALIEEIGEFLSNPAKQIRDAKEFEESRREALGTLVVTTTDSKVTFTWATMFVVLSLIFTPISSSLASVYDNWYWTTFCGALPTILLMISLIICAFKGREFSKIKDYFVEAFNKNGQETSKREYKNTEDPSTFSMRNFFKVINDQLPNDDVLVVVVDNLDRLPQDKVQGVWTMIQSCFNDVTLRFDRIKVIVPFDRNHLKVCQDNEGDKSYIDDYIDKTFDIVFRVPSPVLNDWKDYFDKQWQSVFTNAESDIIRQELDWVKLIFDAFNIEITPRGINAFINSMWSISLLPDLKEIKYRYKALFVCKQSEILQDPLNAMVDLNYLIPLNKHFEEDNEYCKAIAALAYIVPLNRGEEIALIRPLESALSTGDSESIKKFVSVPSFSSILEKVLEKNGHNKLLENYVIALHGLTEDDFGGTEIYQNRWNTLYIFLNDKKYQLSMLGELYIEEYQLNLLEHITPVKQREMAMKIIESLNKVTDIAKFVSSIDALNETLSKYAVNVFNMLQHKKVSFDEPFMDCVRKYDERFF